MVDLPSRLSTWRRGINQQRQITIPLALALVLGAAFSLAWYFRPPPPNPYQGLNWYTADDGATRFVDSGERIPPFFHDGQPAVRMHLYTCDGGKTLFVGYLERIPETTLQLYRAQGIDPATVDDDDLAGAGGWDARRPGDPIWHNSRNDPAGYQRIVTVTAPPGQAGMPTEVFPQKQ